MPSIIVKKYLGACKLIWRRKDASMNFRGDEMLNLISVLVLTKYFLQVRKVGFEIPNSMKFILFEEGGVPLFEGGMLIVFAQFFRGFVYLGGHAY